MTASDHARELVRIAAQAADSKQADDLVALDVSEPLPLTDIFLLPEQIDDIDVVKYLNACRPAAPAAA